MKKLSLILSLSFFSFFAVAQNRNAGDNRTVVVKSESGWNKSDADNSYQNQTVTPEGVVYIPKQDGILLILPRASNNVKLLALTGEVVWSGDLVQGKFFIPTHPGIYFLKINNKSYKVVCK